MWKNKINFCFMFKQIYVTQKVSKLCFTLFCTLKEAPS